MSVAFEMTMNADAQPGISSTGGPPVSSSAAARARRPNACASTLAELLCARLSSSSVVRANEPLAKRTTLRVGGPADLYVEPGTEVDLAAALKFARETAQPVFVLGRGSNLLVRDGGVRGLVICLAQPQFTRIEVRGERLHCGAGTKLKNIANEAKRCAIAGLEFLEGIPGCLGGALRMNAGAYGGEMFRVVESLRFMDYTGQAGDVPGASIDVGYRTCAFFESHIALGAVLKGVEGDRTIIEQRVSECSQKRWSSQPKAPSAGCAFKNPSVIPAGRLIDELGLKGTCVGKARVSLEHGNFIVTEAGATAGDVLGLIELIKRCALTERGIELQSEIKIIGEDP